MDIKRSLKVRWNKVDIKLHAKRRNSEIENKPFTIISNNCWGSFVYQAHNTNYQSPTIGLYFNVDDYLDFLSDLEGNLKTPLTFIDPKDSKRYDILKNKPDYGEHPVGVINGIEIYFLHYKSEEEALNKWNKRIERIDFDRMIVKLSAQSTFKDEHATKFDQLPFKNKLLFTYRELPGIESAVLISGAKDLTEVPVYLEPHGKSKDINITELIKNL